MARVEARLFSTSRVRRFVSYYKPYLPLLIADLLCAFAVSAITLLLPLCVSHLTKNVLGADRPDATARLRRR